jgi:hypothetical protein
MFEDLTRRRYSRELGMRFEGKSVVNAPVDKVWNFISTPRIGCTMSATVVGGLTMARVEREDKSSGATQ